MDHTEATATRVQRNLLLQLELAVGPAIGSVKCEVGDLGQMLVDYPER